MRSTVYIVRHGQDEDNAADILNGRRDRPLTQLGRKQAAMVADIVTSYDISTIYSSPLKRAYETAQIIALKSIIEPVIIVPDLIERDFGNMTGKPVADILKYSSNYIRSDKVIHFLDAEGAESMADVLKRAHRVLDGINKSQINGNFLLVTHGDIGKMLRAAFYGWSWRKGLETPYFDNAEIVELSKP